MSSQIWYYLIFGGDLGGGGGGLELKNLNYSEWPETHFGLGILEIQ